jgi:predicted PurR-regulated permease PerM
LALHLVCSWVFEPALASRVVRLSPLMILLGLAFWGQLWGLVGLFLAVPLTATVRVVLENVPGGAPLAALFSDR